MLDAPMRKLIDPPLNAMGRALSDLGITANAVTMAGLVLGLIAAGAIALNAFWWGLLFIGLSRIADGLDGAVARATKPTDFGGYFDIAADFLFYGAIPLGFVIANPADNAIAGAVLLLSFYFNGTTFLGLAILAEKRHLKSTARGIKSLYFSGGLLEGTETIAFFAVLCIWPATFVWLAYLFAFGSFATGFMRLIKTARAFKQNGSDLIEGE
ncbi:MAG: CDP-alcohol phosphatidyltransferase family protein [Alphaproteobacteria bacterium]|nr:CDP-alcohol phosphatidyltransferase family protein [Alphaproteobacteria bacterium]